MSDHERPPQIEEAEAAIFDIANVLVGRMGLRDAVTLLRRAMLRAALDQAGGSRHRAARILSVHRRAVQRMLQD